MKFSHDGLILWYGTPDAPAPPLVVDASDKISIRIGVYPSSPNNRVQVSYQIDNGCNRTISAILVQSNPTQNTQYFEAFWPKSLSGERVDYYVLLTCSGRQAPDIKTASHSFSSFQLSEPDLDIPSDTGTKNNSTISPSKLPQSTFPTNLKFLGTVKAQLSRLPDVIGQTPEGLKVNWLIQGGEVYGHQLNAKILPKGGDWMTIRPDGIGLVDIRATLETSDGVLINMMSSGVFDLGEKGYQNFISHQWPNAPPLRSTPRFLAEHPMYKWLNRLQCIGIGEVQMSDLLVIYDLYAL